MIRKISLVIVSLLLLTLIIIGLFSDSNNIFMPTNTHIVSAPQVILDAGHEEFSQYYKSKDYRPKCNTPETAFLRFRVTVIIFRLCRL